MKPLHLFAVAVQFLTRIPVRSATPPSPQDQGHALLFYPAVGAVLGAALAGMGALTSWLGVPSALSGALILCFWVALTGALHLDGLADSVDAFAGGRGNRQRTLELMKDPHCGTFAVVTLVLLLMIKASALITLDARLVPGFLLLPPLLGRIAVPWLFMTTPYVRSAGLGRSLADHLPRKPLWFICITSLLCIIVGFGRTGLASTLIACLIAWLWRLKLLEHLQGTREILPALW
jgi:Cobalamin-5-phosphate synthase